MNLLFLTPTAFFSGGERVTLDIAAAMSGRGHEVFYCGLEGPVRATVEASGVPFIPLTQFTPQAVRTLVRKLQPDIVHAMDFRASLYAAFSVVPFIAHLHNNPPWLRHYGTNSWAMLYFSFRAQALLAVSGSIMDEFVFSRLVRHKVALLPNTVDLQSVKSLAQEQESARPYDVVFLGRLTPQKRPLLFVEIVAQLREQLSNIQALIIGDGELRQDVERLIRRYNLESVLTLSGKLDNPFPHLSRSRIMIMPSAWEGFGLAAVEAMTLGKPVLASPVGGLKEVIAGGGFLCATKEEFVEKAHRLLTDESLYETCSLNANTRAKAFDDRRAYFDTVEEIYRTVHKV